MFNLSISWFLINLPQVFISAQVGNMEKPTDGNTDGHVRADGNLNECQKIDESEKVLESQFAFLSLTFEESKKL